MFRNRSLRSALLSVVVLAVAGACGPREPAPLGSDPSLVVMIVIDQARYDYVERFRPLYKGGLAYLLDHGVLFSNAVHDHANTATAPGHATLSTGMEPMHSGVVGNQWFDRRRRQQVYSAGLSGNPSPVYLETKALGDWFKRADPRSKVFSASAKDRAAVMLGGHDPDGVYWYDHDTGRFRSSAYYRRAARPWLREFNEQGWLHRYFGTVWEPLTGPHDWIGKDVVLLDRGVFERRFPYAMGGLSPAPGPGFYEDIFSSPFIDAYLGRFAQTLIENEQLGQDGSVDFLGLSFSALDTVGHAYGPNSPETLDVLCRLDLVLQDLLDLLEREVGLEHVLIALSADHGVAPLPEFEKQVGRPGARVGARDVVCVQKAGLQLAEHYGADDLLMYGFYLDHAAVAAHGLEIDEVASTLAGFVSGCENVQRVWTRTELTGEPRDPDPLAERFRNNLFAGRSPDLLVQFRPYFVPYRGTGTTHGSVYDYDARVPLLIAGPGIAARTVKRRVHTTDLAPTLARLAGVPVPEGLDGAPLTDDLWPARGTKPQRLSAR